MKSRIVSIHQPEMLPWLGFWDKMRQSDVFVLLDHVHFEKNYFQNRNRIRSVSEQGWTWLTVPVKAHLGQPIREVEIDNHSEWRRKALGMLESNYRKAPYFDAHWPRLRAFFDQETLLLSDLTVGIIRWMAASFGIKAELVLSSQLDIEGKRSQLLADICRKLDATEYVSGISGKEYLDEAPFRSARIPVRYQEFFHPIYRQCYEPFVPAMAGIDLLLNCGPDSLKTLENREAPRLTTLFH